MRVEVMNGIGDVTVLPATRVLITLDDGTPVSVASVWIGSGDVTCSHAGQPDFQRVLRNLGVDRTTVVEELKPIPAIDLLDPLG